MKKRALLNLLSEHADALTASERAGELDPEAWLRSRAAIGLDDLLTLLGLAQAIKRVLVPVVAPAVFQAELRGKLLEYPRLQPADRSRLDHRILLFGAAVIGVGLLVLGKFRFGQGARRAHPVTTAI